MAALIKNFIKSLKRVLDVMMLSSIILSVEQQKYSTFLISQVIYIKINCRANVKFSGVGFFSNDVVMEF